MSSWKKTDAHTSAPLWALARVNKAPTAANMASPNGAASGGKPDSSDLPTSGKSKGKPVTSEVI